jgi:hypothetical protein
VRSRPVQSPVQSRQPLLTARAQTWRRSWQER